MSLRPHHYIFRLPFGSSLMGQPALARQAVELYFVLNIMSGRRAIGPSLDGVDMLALPGPPIMRLRVPQFSRLSLGHWGLHGVCLFMLWRIPGLPPRVLTGLAVSSMPNVRTRSTREFVLLCKYIRWEAPCCILTGCRAIAALQPTSWRMLLPGTLPKILLLLPASRPRLMPFGGTPCSRMDAF